MGAGGNRDSRIEYLADMSSLRCRSRMMCSAVVGARFSFDFGSAAASPKSCGLFFFLAVRLPRDRFDFSTGGVFGAEDMGVVGVGISNPRVPVCTEQGLEFPAKGFRMLAGASIAEVTTRMALLL